MDQIRKIAILGGNGRTGKFLVDQLTKSGYALKLLIRNTTDFSFNSLSTSIEVVQGDALDDHKIDLLLKDCQAVISTISQRAGEPLVSSKATMSIVSSMEKHLIKRLIVVAGINIDTPFDNKGERTVMATEWVKANFKVAHDDKQKSYSILSRSDLDWTVVRVPMIHFEEGASRVVSDLKDCKGDSVSAASIADFVIEQIEVKGFIKEAPFIWNV